ncbi:type II secretion system assembly factor GspB [Serratia sp. UGAL515B_01]|uniref:type II secretion system assembly factor GspB n=1 Tax=Serratia sp. UGAL515B_01 TaxID=2986763 RepID=UPI002955D66A|nr:type II secretion system assembly factor GspB [Serratia sp. UGAL515B_01]WON76404.1 type II secretion system assembly factor GspB [Serratia sp. UGAL515B_01]
MDKQTESAPEVRKHDTRGLFIPHYLLPIYALLFIALGWFSREHWLSSPILDHTAVTIAKVVPSAVAQNHVAQVKPDVTVVAKKDAAKQNSTAVQPPQAKALASDELPVLHYSAHIYASEDEKRSITMNGQRYKEGDSPAPNLTIEQIQQDVTIFDFNGEVFTLDALEDWPGGNVDVANSTER